jgi:TonB-dependent SusC/RagA subfamily outer membrane receptor
MKTSLKVIIIFFIFIISNSTFAQKKEKIKISGFVKDSLNKPIKDCIIFIDNIKQKKKTNKKGYYSLKLKSTPKKLTYYSNRHGLTELNFPNKRNIDVTFKKMGVKEKLKFKEIEESENKNRYRFKDIYSYIRGRVAGVRVLPDNTILVRGITSLKGSNQPLFVLNKMAINIEGLEYINPNDIKSVKVLKGSEATIWGVRGAAGVILITTY